MNERGKSLLRQDEGTSGQIPQPASLNITLFADDIQLWLMHNAASCGYSANGIWVDAHNQQIERSCQCLISIGYQTIARKMKTYFSFSNALNRAAKMHAKLMSICKRCRKG